MEAQNGLSLFKDSNSMFINNSLLLRQEEEDALEEERQQNENILKKLSEAFDITSDDDDEDDDDDDDDDDDECSNTSHQSHVTDKSTSYEDKSSTKTCASKSSHRKAVESKQGHHKLKTVSCSSRNESNRFHRKHNLSSVYEDESDISYNSNEATLQSKRATQLSNKATQLSNKATQQNNRATQQNNKATQQNNKATQQSNRRSVSPHYKHCTQSINNSVANSSSRSPVITKSNSVANSSSRSPAIDKSNSVANSSPDALQNNSEDASQNEAYLKSRYQSMDQLSVLYDVRLREVEKLKNSLSQEQQKCNMLERKIMILESEKSGAELSYRQTQELLVSSKQQISALEEQIKELKNGLANLEKSKTQNESELITSRDIINDLQARIRFLEKNDPSQAAVKQMESTIKSLQNQHMQEVASLQLQLKNKTAKLEEKEDNLKSMEGRVLDLETKLTTTLVEKSDALNSVMRDLEVSQRQCRELMASCDVTRCDITRPQSQQQGSLKCDVTRHQSQSSDVTRLQSQLQDALAKNKELNRTLSKRDAECISLRADLEQAETLSKLALDSFDDSTMHLGKVARPTCDAAMIQADNCNKLKSELHRALQDKRAKRQEIKELRQTLDSRNSRIKQMEEHENAYKAEVERLKVNMLKLTEEVDRKCKDSLDSSNKSCILKTEKEVQCNIAVNVGTNLLENLNKQLSRAEDEIVFLKREMDSREVELKTMKCVLDESKRHSGDGDSSIDLTIERMKINEKKMKQELESKIIELRVTMEQKDKECDDLKKMYIELKGAKENAIKTIESNHNTRISKLMTDLDCSTSKMKEMEIHAQEIKNKYQTTLEENHQLSSNLEEVTDLFMQLVSKLKPDQISGDSNSNATKLKSIAELKEIASEIIFGDKDSNNDTLKMEYELKIREKEKEIGTLRSLLDSKEKNLADALALVKKTETESVSATVMNQCNTDSNNCSDLEVISANYEEKLRLLQNEHALQTKRLEQDYSKKVSAIERSHSEIINTIKKEIEAKMKEVEEREKYILNDFQQRLIDQENNLKSKYLADLNAAEETAKTLTIQHFASQVKKIEEYYQKEYESSRTKMEQAAINSINTLKRVIAEKEKEIFDLKSMNQKSSNEKVNMLEKKSEEDRMKLIILTKQVTEMQEELSSKQKSINKLSVELNDAVREKRELNYRIDVLKNRSNEVIKSQFTKVLNRLQLQIDENLFKGANEYDRKIQEVEEMYSARENEMKKRDKS